MLLFDPSWGGPHQRAQPGAAQKQPGAGQEYTYRLLPTTTYYYYYYYYDYYYYYYYY